MEESAASSRDALEVIVLAQIPPSSRIASTLMPPGRRTTGGSRRPSTTVDSKPTEQGPPSMINGMRFRRSVNTCDALVGDGFPEALAEGAARGREERWQSA